MKTSDAFWQFLPKGLNELFEMVKFEKTGQSYDIWLDEKKKLSDEDYRNPTRLHGLCDHPGLSYAWQTGLSSHA